MEEIVLKVILGVLLLLCGIQDAIKKKVSLWLIIMGAILTIVCLPLCNSITLLDRIGGLATGVVVLLISKGTEQKIGIGDGLLLCITGIGLGFWGNLELFGIALFFAALLGIFLLVSHRADRKKSIPFVPFLLLSYLILIIL